MRDEYLEAQIRDTAEKYKKEEEDLEVTEQLKGFTSIGHDIL